MQELTQAQYERVMPLFKDIPQQRPVVFAVLEGTQSGRVFSDDIQNPTTAVILADWSYIGGEIPQPDRVADVAGLLVSEIFPRQEHVLLYPFSAAWMKALEEIFQTYHPAIYMRTRFDFDPWRYHDLHSGWKQRVPPGFSVERINAETAPWVDGIAELWGTSENFLAHGFGFGVFDQSQPDPRQALIAGAHTVFVGDRWAETGVGTREGYRRKGLATAASCAYLDYCLEHGYFPEWTCMYNDPSERLAYKMGFVNKQDWPFLYLHNAGKDQDNKN